MRGPDHMGTDLNARRGWAIWVVGAAPRPQSEIAYLVLVVDPTLGTGISLVEAVHSGRNGVGVNCEQSWVTRSGENLELARTPGGNGPAVVMHAQADRGQAADQRNSSQAAGAVGSHADA